MILRIKNVRFVIPVHIQASNGATQWTHLESSRFDLELTDYTFLSIKEKASGKTVSIIPFGNCVCLSPLDEALFSSLDDAFPDNDEDLGESPSPTDDESMMEVIPAKRKGRPTNAEMERRRQAAGL